MAKAANRPHPTGYNRETRRRMARFEARVRKASIRRRFEGLKRSAALSERDARIVEALEAAGIDPADATPSDRANAVLSVQVDCVVKRANLLRPV